MVIDSGVLEMSSKPVTTGWSSTDALLYAVAIGAGTEELACTTERVRGPHTILVGEQLEVEGPR